MYTLVVVLGTAVVATTVWVLDIHGRTPLGWEVFKSVYVLCGCSICLVGTRLLTSADTTGDTTN